MSSSGSCLTSNVKPQISEMILHWDRDCKGLVTSTNDFQISFPRLVHIDCKSNSLVTVFISYSLYCTQRSFPSSFVLYKNSVLDAQKMFVLYCLNSGHKTTKSHVVTNRHWGYNSNVFTRTIWLFWAEQSKRHQPGSCKRIHTVSINDEMIWLVYYFPCLGWLHLRKIWAQKAKRN